LKYTNRLIKFAAFNLGLFSLSLLAQAQDYPAKPIKLVVPYAAGAITAVSYTHLTLPTKLL
jgi:tripartite-type tricarboxylate transporter receptor subunit TctC